MTSWHQHAARTRLDWFLCCMPHVCTSDGCRAARGPPPPQTRSAPRSRQRAPEQAAPPRPPPQPQRPAACLGRLQRRSRHRHPRRRPRRPARSPRPRAGSPCPTGAACCRAPRSPAAAGRPTAPGARPGPARGRDPRSNAAHHQPSPQMQACAHQPCAACSGAHAGRELMGGRRGRGRGGG